MAMEGVAVEVGLGASGESEAARLGDEAPLVVEEADCERSLLRDWSSEDAEGD